MKKQVDYDTILKQFLSKIWHKDYKQRNNCWEWVGERDKDGYGVFYLNNYPQRAHRISYWLFNHKPGNLFVCHSCDNPWCVNPEHLWLGTDFANKQDMRIKNRDNRAKVTDCDITFINRLPSKYR